MKKPNLKKITKDMQKNMLPFGIGFLLAAITLKLPNKIQLFIVVAVGVILIVSISLFSYLKNKDKKGVKV